MVYQYAGKGDFPTSLRTPDLKGNRSDISSVIEFTSTE